MSDLIRRLQNTDRCYCGSEVIDGELKLVGCMFHQAAYALSQKDKRIKELAVRSVKYGRGIDRRNKLIGKKNEEIRYLRKWKWDAEKTNETPCRIGVMDKRTIVLAVILGFIFYVGLSVWVPELLAEARRALCDEGSLKQEFCSNPT